MKILIGTPAYGGQIFTDYLISMVTTQRGFYRDNVDFALYTIDNESFINRARDKIANEAMNGDYDKLIFIDADIGWTYDDICNLCNSDKDIIGGTYPMKTLPIQLNFNPAPDHFDYFTDNIRDVDNFNRYKDEQSENNGEIEVLHIPTGFMSINTSFFHKLKDKVQSYTSGGKLTYNFFPHGIKNGVLESEDWAFCSLARENGIPIHLNTKIVLSHAGTYKYKI